MFLFDLLLETPKTGVPRFHNASYVLEFKTFYSRHFFEVFMQRGIPIRRLDRLVGIFPVSSLACPCAFETPLIEVLEKFPENMA